MPKSENLFCDYYTGMFAHNELGAAEQLFYEEMVSYHEAGHAVVGFALGLGCVSISLRNTKINRNKYIISGEARGKISATTQLKRILKQNPRWSKLYATHGICSAAGPAAERKYCFLSGMGYCALGGSEGDHESISGLSKLLSMKHARTGYAFERLVWRNAQKFLEIPEIWQAVEEIAFVLSNLYSPYLEEIDNDHSAFEIMPGSQARAIMRRSGVRPGMLA